MIPANNGNAHKDNSDPQCATGKESDRSEMPDMPLGFFFWVTVSTYVYIYIYSEYNDYDCIYNDYDSCILKW